VSIYASFDEHGGEQIASNQGWSDFGNWVETLDANEFDQLIVLWEHGWTPEVETLAKELGEALQKYPPDEKITATGQALLSALQGSTNAEAVYVNNGMTKV
jgi:hypothetical protein